MLCLSPQCVTRLLFVLLEPCFDATPTCAHRCEHIIISTAGQPRGAPKRQGERQLHSVRVHRWQGMPGHIPTWSSKRALLPEELVPHEQVARHPPSTVARRPAPLRAHPAKFVSLGVPGDEDAAAAAAAAADAARASSAPAAGSFPPEGELPLPLPPRLPPATLFEDLAEPVAKVCVCVFRGGRGAFSGAYALVRACPLSRLHIS